MKDGAKSVINSPWFKEKWHPLHQLQVWEFMDDQFSCLDQSDEVWGTKEWTVWNASLTIIPAM